MDHARARFVERFALLLVDAGMQRMQARVFACVLADDAEHGLTAAEIGERLGVSPAAVSGATRALITGGLLFRDRVPGERRDRYRVGDDLWGDMYLARIQLLARWSSFLDDAARAIGPGKGSERLQESRDFFLFLQAEMPPLFERWRELRGRKA